MTIWLEKIVLFISVFAILDTLIDFYSIYTANTDKSYEEPWKITNYKLQLKTKTQKPSQK